jgi:hypothetical protein
MKQPKQEWIEEFDKLTRGSEIFIDYPNGGFIKGKENIKHFISSLLLSQRKEVIGEIIEEINTTNIESNFGLKEDLVESIKILLINNLNKLK